MSDTKNIFDVLRLQCFFKHFFFDSRWRHIFSFWIARQLPVAHSSEKIIRMKSRMAFIKCNGCTERFNIKQIFMWQRVSLTLHVINSEIIAVLGTNYTTVAMSWKVDPVKPVNHTSWVAVLTPTDSPKSVHNRRGIDYFGDVFVFPLCGFECSVGEGFFVIRLNRIFSFFSFPEALP